MESKKSIWIAGITRGHNSGVCLLKDGKIVFAIEEERISRHKYDGGPFAAMIKILEYTDKLDYLVIAHTQSLDTAGKVDFTGDNVYTGLARKLGLISRTEDLYNHPQVIDMSRIHHKLHAACAFYRSGFQEAVAVIVDGAGTFINLSTNDSGQQETVWELESIINCAYPAEFKTIYKHLGGRGPMSAMRVSDMDASRELEEGTYELVLDDTAGIVKAYEAVTQYCGWSSIEAGKTMGLFPYGKSNDKIPPIYSDGGGGMWRTTDRNLIIPTYPNGAIVNEGRYEYLLTDAAAIERGDVTLMQNRRDLAYAVQTQSQEEVALLIEKAVKDTGHKNVVLSGGYALNCVANYFYLDRLKDLGINLYVEPISSDAGTGIGAALLFYNSLVENTIVSKKITTLYMGPNKLYADNEIQSTVEIYSGVITDNVTKSDIIDLITDKNIVTIFQGKSECGPRALGNRSIMFDPTFKYGKDFVNNVKHREYFRPFAGSILKEHVHDWFDLRGMEDSPFMMYAVNCKFGVEDKIPSIIHIDNTCRIQTVTAEENPHYHELITEFYKRTGVPIIFNTSFNLGGEPLVETLDDAVRTLANSEIEYLYLPEYNKLITVKNK